MYETQFVFILCSLASCFLRSPFGGRLFRAFPTACRRWLSVFSALSRQADTTLRHPVSLTAATCHCWLFILAALVGCPARLGRKLFHMPRPDAPALLPSCPGCPGRPWATKQQIDSEEAAAKIAHPRYTLRRADTGRKSYRSRCWMYCKNASILPRARPRVAPFSRCAECVGRKLDTRTAESRAENFL